MTGRSMPVRLVVLIAITGVHVLLVRFGHRHLPASTVRPQPAAIHVPLLALALFLHGRNLRRQRVVRRVSGRYTSP